MKNDTNIENEEVSPEKKLDVEENNSATLHALKMISGKWKISLIQIIASNCPKRFGALKKELDNLAQGTLSSVLKELEKDEIIDRKLYPEIPPRVEYKLTPKGIRLLPILQSLSEWWQEDATAKKTTMLP